MMIPVLQLHVPASAQSPGLIDPGLETCKQQVAVVSISQTGKQQQKKTLTQRPLVSVSCS